MAPATPEEPGIVKKLLFPSFADAGSNDAFQKSPHSPQQEQETTGSVISEATTAVHDNRSHRADNQRTTRSQAQPPPFFATTRPIPASKVSSLQQAIQRQQQQSQQQVTPTKQSQIARTFQSARSFSTVAMARGERITSSSDDVVQASDGEEETGDSSGVDIIASEADTDAAGGADGEPLHESSRTDKATERGDDYDADEENIADPPNLSNSINEKDLQSLHWEEEATPAQTAFGKQLLFARNLDQNSDVLSTASEMGTVIGPAQIDDLTDLAAQQQNSDGDAQLPWDSPELSLPVLEEDATNTRNNHFENQQEESEEKKNTEDYPSPRSRDKSRASEMLTMAIRRIGSGLTGNGHNRGSVSAPNTPRQSWHAAHSQQQRLQQHPPSPRSHDSNPHFQPTTPRRSRDLATETTPSSFLLRSPGSAAFQLASSIADRRKLLSPRFSSKQLHHIDKIDEDKVAMQDTSTSKAFKMARSCFSFDAYDTSMDEIFEVSMSNSDADFAGYLESRKDSRKLDRHRFLYEPSKQIRQSASWDVGGVSTRDTPFRSEQRLEQSNDYANSFASPERRRVRIMEGNFSRSQRSDTMEWKTPQRIEIEREDALDILSCLVERGISLQPSDEELSPEATTAKEVKDTKGDFVNGDKPSPLVSSAIKEFKVLSRTGAEEEEAHSQRMLALDELIRSHEYALEMRRASQSALSWLKSIDRSQGSAEAARVTMKAQNDVSTMATVGNMSLDSATSSSGSIDLLTAKAMLHSAQLEAKEKAELSDRLNEELAKCRAEIGRLRSSSQSVPFKSPNRSILDESDDLSIDEEGETDKSFDTASPIVGVDSSGFFESSFLDSHKDHNKELLVDDSVATYKSALVKANEQIRKLYGQLEPTKRPEEAPVVVIPLTVDTLSESPGNKEERTINVRMLDGENFVTEWADLTPPLPPPPDHGLRAPIIEAVLEQWTEDTNLHESLLEWIDQVLAGQDSDSIPPLTLSNLDHQVRDGFVMHVLPLLLRRADIRVDVKTRAHRATSYDLSVSVEPSRPFATLDFRHHWENPAPESEAGTMSVAPSTATTALVTNTHPATIPLNSGTPSNAAVVAYEASSRLSYDEMAEAGLGVDNQQGGIMHALGGAIGGLLHRNPNGQQARKSHPQHLQDGSPDLSSPAAQTAAAADAHLADSVAADAEEPYHRVVSAPSGRIGVTFVEYRGHAMVSDVADDSPLVGWIFPSDILIAIDELPVSGMKVRDIIQVLRDRDERQRALRVISSHAMNDLTNMNSSVLDGPS